MIFFRAPLPPSKELEDPRLEHLLNGPALKDWLLHLHDDRGVGFNTLVTYITSILQAMNALQAMQLSGLSGMSRLVTELEAVRTQLGKRQKHVKGHKEMKHAKLIMAAIATSDQEKLAQIPGPLQYGLALEHCSKIAEMWVAIFHQIPPKMWTQWHGKWETYQQGILATVAKEVLACWWRSVQVSMVSVCSVCPFPVCPPS